MNPNKLKKILQDVVKGKTDIKSAMELLKTLPYEDIGFARLDYHRQLRSKQPEAVYCPGKSPSQILKIIQSFQNSGNDVLATRLEKSVFTKIKKRLPKKAKYHPIAKVLVINAPKKFLSIGQVLVLTAGTSDIPIAEETSITAEFLGSSVKRIFDVGVAGIHRLFDQIDQLRQARVIVVVAGMDGALPSVVGGLVDKPVIAVPTSIGYGASFQGLAPLLAMLSSCAPGIATVNIDNGFGAGILAHKINSLGGILNS